MGDEKIAILISCTDHYRERMHIFDSFLSDNGYKTQYIASDFHHIEKTPFKCSIKDSIQLHVRPYKKNLSVSRILSHRDFAKGVYNYLKNLNYEPDLIVCEIPPNFLAKYVSKYKKQHPNVKLIFDIFDLWPETFPSNSMKRLLKLPFKIWGSLRDKNIFTANSVITECNMYQKVLGTADNPKVNTLYLSAQKFENQPAKNINTDRIVLCYLGSVNNVIDIQRIENFITKLNSLKPCKVNVIGNGERMDDFLYALNKTGAEIEFHGVVYDNEKKRKIISECHFGLNIVKSSVCIALTMKSIDYFSFGLPIINTVSGDTLELVENEKVGFNLDDTTAKTVASLREEELTALRQNVQRVFDENFEISVIKGKLETIIKNL